MVWSEQNKKILRDKIQKGAKKDQNGCWNWSDKNANTVYGVILIGGRKVSARRASYQAFDKSPALGRRVVRSTCQNPSCVNPDHLERGDRNRGGVGGVPGKQSADYPWDDWFAKKCFELVRKVHYQCKDYAMAQQVRNRAQLVGVSVHVRIGEGKINVVIGPYKPERKKNAKAS